MCSDACIIKFKRTVSELIIQKIWKQPAGITKNKEFDRLNEDLMRSMISSAKLPAQRVDAARTILSISSSCHQKTDPASPLVPVRYVRI